MKRKYTVWCPNYGEDHPEDGRTIEANSPQWAAEEWAQRTDSDSADYTIVSGDTQIVYVLDQETGERTKWSVSGEALPSYCASQVEAGDD